MLYPTELRAQQLAIRTDYAANEPVGQVLTEIDCEVTAP